MQISSTAFYFKGSRTNSCLSQLEISHNRDLIALFEENLSQIVDSFAAHTFVELNRSELITHQ